MRKTKMMLLGVLLATAGASWTATAAGIDQYALKEFTADFTQFHIGDTVPAMYLTRNTTSNSGSSVTCLRRTPAATGPIWAVTTF